MFLARMRTAMAPKLQGLPLVGGVEIAPRSSCAPEARRARRREPPSRSQSVLMVQRGGSRNAGPKEGEYGK